MLTALTSLFGTTPVLESKDDATLREWQHLLETATSAHERDEINDVFGKAVTAA